MGLIRPARRARHRTGRAAEGLRIAGRLSLAVVDADGNIVDRREGYNVICTTGYTVLAQALVWSGIQDQASALGITSATYLTPLWGAVGNGAGTPVKSDTALFSELSRTTVGAGASGPASSTVPGITSWMFFFPNPAVPWTVTEAGVFANATSAAGSGAMIDHWAFSPSLSVPTSNGLVFQVDLEWGP